MIWAVAIAVGVVSAAGVYLALSRDLFRCIVGVSILGAAAGLLVFAAGRLASRTPPILIPGPPGSLRPDGALQAVGQDALGLAANPLPQALVLTAIVIGFALTCFSLVLVVRIVQKLGADEARDLRLSEAEDGGDGAP